MLYCSFAACSWHKTGWLGGVTVGRESGSRSNGRGFDSMRGRYQVTTLDKLFTLMCLCHQAE